MDHYATLGVPPDAAPAAIRAAYVKLMRQYHPDRNLSAAAAGKARAITAAYAVLSSAEGRANYDFERKRSRLIQLIDRPIDIDEAPAARWKSAWLPPIVGISAMLLLVLTLFEPPSLPVRQPTSVGGQERQLPLQGQRERAAAAFETAECGSPAVSNLLKRALFSRALRLRPDGSAQLKSLLSQSRVLTAGATPMVGAPASGSVHCEAIIAVDLPPGMTTRAGAQAIEGTIAYTLKPANGNKAGTIGLTSDGSFPATLSGIRSAIHRPEIAPTQLGSSLAVQEPTIRDQRPMASERFEHSPPLPRPKQSAVVARPARQVFQNPSFNCHSARSRGALLVCNSAFLAALDRDLAKLYNNSAAANPSLVPLLRRNDSRFLARRDACATEGCVVNAYFAAIREMQDITARTSRPSNQ